MRSGRRSQRPVSFGRGQVCAVAGCTTLLSAYNPTEYCSLHEGCGRTGPRRDPAPPVELRACANAGCGELFEATNARRRYCSDACRVSAFLARKREIEGTDAQR